MHRAILKGHWRGEGEGEELSDSNIYRIHVNRGGPSQVDGSHSDTTGLEQLNGGHGM